MEYSVQLQKHFETLANKYHVGRIGVFGSLARGEGTEKSDIDILVEFSEDVDLFHFIRLKGYLADVLGKDVDLVTPDALKPLIKEQVLKEVHYI